MADTHKVTKTKVVQLENGAYGVEFEFDDGYTDFAEVGSKATADFYATVQMWESIVMGVGAVRKAVGIESGVVSGVINLESPSVSASGWRPRHDKRYHEA